jgi:hypothetical protein
MRACWRRTLAALSLAVGASLILAPVGHSDRGVGISTGEITVATRLAPGAGYELPRISVSNTGDVVTSYEVTLTYLEGQAQRRPEAAWFDFDPRRFTLEPGEARDVIIALTIPTSAEPGEYFALLQAKTAPDQPGATSVGVAAATKLGFSVSASGWLDAQWRGLNRRLDDAFPWTFVVAGAVAGAFLATKAGRLPFRIRLERR